MAEKVLRVGVYGAKRGRSHIKAIAVLDDAEVVALCEQNPTTLEAALKYCPPDVKICQDYDQLLDSNLDLVVLCNYLPDHTACAIKALRKGIPVVSECLAAATMKECVELVEAVEETGVYYSMAENTPYGTAYLEIQRLYRSGMLGNLVYGEAEYCHPIEPGKLKGVRPTPDHWRNFMPKTYYLSHPLGALMNVSRLMPKRVVGMVTPDADYAKARGIDNADSGGILLVEMENGTVFRVTGCTQFGTHVSCMRIACTKGYAETLRHDKGKVSLGFNPWDLPKEMERVGTHLAYAPPMEPDVTEAISRGLSTGGHMVADYRAVRNYIAEIKEGKAPDMNVYRATAMSAVAILGWRSVLNDSCSIDIPDFRDAAARDQYRNDDLSPWRGEIPYCKYPFGTSSTKKKETTI